MRATLRADIPCRTFGPNLKNRVRTRQIPNLMRIANRDIERRFRRLFHAHAGLRLPSGHVVSRRLHRRRYPRSRRTRCFVVVIEVHRFHHPAKRRRFEMGRWEVERLAAAGSVLSEAAQGAVRAVVVPGSYRPRVPEAQGNRPTASSRGFWVPYRRGVRSAASAGGFGIGRCG